jgi:hypothetical protein
MNLERSMLELVQAPNHVAAFRVTDELTAEDYDRLVAELELRLKVHARIGVYVDATGLNGISTAALTKDLRYGLSKLGQMARFPRSAVVSDRAWLRKVVEVATAILPTMEVRAFDSGERDSALEWVGRLEPDAPSIAGLRLISTTRPDTFAIVWSGKISESDLAHVTQQLDAALRTQPQLRLLARLDRIGGIAWRALFNAQLAHVKLVGAGKIERYALVGDQTWLDGYVRMMRSIAGIDMRQFATTDEAAAWTWLEAQPAADSGDGRPPVAEATGAPLN